MSLLQFVTVLFLTMFFPVLPAQTTNLYYNNPLTTADHIVHHSETGHTISLEATEASRIQPVQATETVQVTVGHSEQSSTESVQTQGAETITELPKTVQATTEPPETQSAETTTEPPETQSTETTTEPPETQSAETTTEPSETQSAETTTEPHETQSVETTTEAPETQTLQITTEEPETQTVETTTEPPETQDLQMTTEPVETYTPQSVETTQAFKSHASTQSYQNIVEAVSETSTLQVFLSLITSTAETSPVTALHAFPVFLGSHVPHGSSSSPSVWILPRGPSTSPYVEHSIPNEASSEGQLSSPSVMTPISYRTKAGGNKTSMLWMVIVLLLGVTVLVTVFGFAAWCVSHQRKRRLHTFSTLLRSSRSSKSKGTNSDTWAGPVILHVEGDGYDKVEDGTHGKHDVGGAEGMLITFTPKEAGTGAPLSPELKRWEEMERLLFIDEGGDEQQGAMTSLTSSV